MRGSLFGRVAVVLALMVVALAALMLQVAGQRERWHADQVQQALHRALASHMVDDNPLLRHGEIVAASLENAFHALMLLGPAFEIYATDPDGRLRAFSAEPGLVRETRIDLSPVRDFLAGQPLPIYGTDPRDPGRRQVFSAAPILDPAGALRGYVYVIVGGSQLSAVERQHEAGLWQDRALLFSLGALALVVLLSGLLFGLLTRPLAALNCAMAAFRRGGLSRDAIGRQLPGWASREVAELQAGFVDLAETVADQLAQIRSNEAARRELIAQIAHDLKTPLASLQGYLETWLLQHPGAPDRQHVEVALRNGRQLHRLVEQLLELARLEARQERLEAEPVAVLELAHDVAARFALDARRRGVGLVVSGDEDILARADIGKLERVLVNLVDNALEHTPAGGEVRIGVLREGTAVRFEVRDSGCGIPAGHQARIFEPRYRVHGAPGGDGPHLGLGLAIVQRLLALHGSTIEVDSAPGRGASFSFGLALA